MNLATFLAKQTMDARVHTNHSLRRHHRSWRHLVDGARPHSSRHGGGSSSSSSVLRSSTIAGGKDSNGRWGNSPRRRAPGGGVGTAVSGSSGGRQSSGFGIGKRGKRSGSGGGGGESKNNPVPTHASSGPLRRMWSARRTRSSRRNGRHVLAKLAAAYENSPEAYENNAIVTAVIDGTLQDMPRAPDLFLRTKSSFANSKWNQVCPCVLVCA